MIAQSPVNVVHHDLASLGDRMADRVAKRFASWRFLGYMTMFIIVWISLNLIAVGLRWDPYPFILLILVFSTQASYAAPVILLAQNRSADRDRIQADHDFACNQRAEAKIDLLLRQLKVPQDVIESINAEVESLLTPAPSDAMPRRAGR